MTLTLLFTVVALLSGPAPADCVISTEVEWDHLNLTLDESVKVVVGGALRVISSNITFNCSSTMQYGITVEMGGALTVTDADGLPSTAWDSSTITAPQPFFLVAKAGSELHIQNSFITNCGGRDDPFNSGMQVQTSGWTIEGSVLRDSLGGATLTGCADGSIRGSSFINLNIGVCAIGAANISLEDSSFTGLETGAFFFSSTGSRFTRCQFTQIRRDALRLDSCPDVEVDGCTFRGCPTYGMYLKGDSGLAGAMDAAVGTEVNGCTFDGTAYPLVLDNMRGVTVMGCSFRWFTCALSLWKMFATSVSFKSNALELGGTGIECGVGTLNEMTIANNTFANLTTAVVPMGDRVRIEDNVITDMISSGIRQTGNGIVLVARNRFVNCTYAVRIERDQLYDPGMTLTSNRFADNRYGILARDVRTLTMAQNTWRGGRTALMLLNLDVSGIAHETVEAADVGCSIMGVRGTMRNITIVDCDVGIVADVGTLVRFDACSLTRCAMDAVAGNVSRLSLRDTPGVDALSVVDETSEILVEWTVSIRLLYRSTGRPAMDVPLALVPSGHPQVGQYASDADGLVGPVVVPIALAVLDGVEEYNPYDAVVSHRRSAHALQVVLETVHLFVLHIDDVPPRLEMLEPADGSVLDSSTVRCVVSVTDDDGTVASALLYVDGRMVVDVMANIEGLPAWLVLPHGEHELVLTAEDDWSNVCSMTMHITVDTEPPRIAITEPTNGTVTRTRSAVVSGTITGHSLAIIQGQPIATAADGSFSVQVELPVEGLTSIEIRAWDAAGNDRTERIDVIRDTVPPVITLDEMPGLTNAPAIYISGETDGDLVRCLATDGTLPGRGPFTFLVPLAEGSNLIVVEASDSAGNTASSCATCVSDRRVEFEVVEPINGATVELAYVRINATGELGLRINLTGPETTLSLNGTLHGNLSFDVGPLKAGTSLFVFNVTDAAGNSAVLVYVLNLNEQPRRVSDEGHPWPLVVLLGIISLFISMATLILWRRREV